MAKCNDNRRKRLKRRDNDNKRREDRLLGRICLHFKFLGKTILSYKKTKHSLKLFFYDTKSGQGNNRHRHLTINNFSDLDKMEKLWSKDGVVYADGKIITYERMREALTTPDYDYMSDIGAPSE